MSAAYFRRVLKYFSAQPGPRAAVHICMLNWNKPDDEPTLVLHTLASIDLSPIAIVEETTPLAEVRRSNASAKLSS
jgi:hypothetical protein